MTEVMDQSTFACPNESGGPFNLYNTRKFDGGLFEGGEEARLKALASLGLVDTRRESMFDAITDFLKKFFETPGSHLVLIDPDRCWFKSWQGMWWDYAQELEYGPSVQCVREEGWCNYIFVPTTAELLIIEDATTDARVSLNTFVVGPPYFKFYAGAPLVGSCGERYGTLCVVDVVPRTFTAEHYALLTNFAALAVEEVERNKPICDKVQAINSVSLNRHLDLSLQASQEGLLMVDMRQSKWPVVYANTNFETTTGIATDVLVGANFWDLFQCRSKTRREIGLYTGLGDTFTMQVLCKSTQKVLTLRLLPATSDRLAPSKATGLPPWAPFTTSPINDKSDGSSAIQKKSGEIFDSVKCFWFLMVCASSEATSTHTSSMTTASLTESLNSIDGTSTTLGSGSSSEKDGESDINASGFTDRYCDYKVPDELGIQGLGPLLGSGSFGRVYRAHNVDGEVVAIKVVDCRQRNDAALEAQLKEIQLTRSLEHPHLVKVLAYATSTNIDKGKPVDILWMVQELCDLGTLSRCAERGLLRLECNLNSPPDMKILLTTLFDISSTMAYVHGMGIIHADLTGRNVLLSRMENKPGGFMIKICDFGLAQYTYQRPFPTRTLGTITHMPPELLKLEDPVLVPESDIWAFGIIAWEAYHGKNCYQGKSAPKIVLAVTQNIPLPWPEDAPSDFVALIKQCLAFNYKDRLPFATVSQSLENQRSA